MLYRCLLDKTAHRCEPLADFIRKENSLVVRGRAKSLTQDPQPILCRTHCDSRWGSL
jgi:hypothetical protein